MAEGVGVPPDKDLVCAPAKERQDARWAEAARARMLQLRRHPGHDGPTVCACTECALWTLLGVALDVLAASGASAPEGRSPDDEDWLTLTAEAVKRRKAELAECRVDRDSLAIDNARLLSDCVRLREQVKALESALRNERASAWWGRP